MPHRPAFFITGTDTGAGKTYVTCLMLRSLRQSGRDAVGMKPICCGDRSDAEALFEASGGSIPIDEINPVWLRTPAAPAVAAALENHPVDIARIRSRYDRLHESHPSVLVEGVGGWLVPIKAGYWTSDLAAELGLPVIVVVPNRLGAINHAALTVRHIESMGLHCAGIVLNHFPGKVDVATTSNARTIEEFIGIPILFQVESGQDRIEWML